MQRGWRGTQTLIVDRIYGGGRPHPLQLLVVSVVLSAMGIALARHFFETGRGAISIFLCVLGLLPTLDRLVDRHGRLDRGEHDAVLGGLVSADGRLVGSVLALFAGVMVAYGAWAIALPLPDVRETFAAQLSPWAGLDEPGFAPRDFGWILGNNLLVLVGVLAFSILYRAGGALVILCWNASIWGAAFAYFARLEWGGGLAAVGGWLATSACVFPHVLLEAAGYVMTAVAGLIVLRLAVRFRRLAGKRAALVRGAALLLAAAVAALVLAAAAEAFLAPLLLDQMPSPPT